ncbi:hypothetical protein PTKIN_Ptkin08bG0085400 [Pterospermum kingtungense]
MMGTIKAIWKLNRKAEILAVEENLFLFKFQREAKNRVLEEAPWTCDKHLLLFKDFDRDLRPEQYVFNTTTFYLKMYDLPLGM